MAAYIVRRLIWVIFLLFVVTLITFIIFTVLPAADPAVLRAGRQPSPELVASIREQFGLDDPKHVQFFRYVGRHPAVRRRRRRRTSATRTSPTRRSCRRSSTACRRRSSSPAARSSSGCRRHPDRHDLGGQDRLAARPPPDGHRAHLHLGAGLLPRPRRAVPVRRRHRASSRCCPGSGAYQDADRRSPARPRR